MHIRITQAKRFKTVRIGEEKVTVGEVTPVSDTFIHRLENEFPSFEFEVVEADHTDSETAGGAGDGTGLGGDAEATDDNDKGGTA